MKTRFFMMLVASCTLIFGLTLSCQKENRSASQIEKKAPDVPGDPQVRPSCDTRTANSTIETENHDVPLLSEDNGYEFRDDFMEAYELGQQYIDYYYTISENSTNFNMWLNHFTECYDFAVASYEVADILLNGDGNEVIITQTYHDMAVDMINLYRSYTPSGDSFNDILDAIEGDMDTFLDLTRDEVIAILEN